jgi:hypothetical protein
MADGTETHRQAKREYTNRGVVGGYGKICERPYAWLDD